MGRNFDGVVACSWPTGTDLHWETQRESFADEIAKGDEWKSDGNYAGFRAEHSHLRGL
jgi:hypothetical protein